MVEELDVVEVVEVSLARRIEIMGMAARMGFRLVVGKMATQGSLLIGNAHPLEGLVSPSEGEVVVAGLEEAKVKGILSAPGGLMNVVVGLVAGARSSARVLDVAIGALLLMMFRSWVLSLKFSVLGFRAFSLLIFCSICFLMDKGGGRKREC